MPVGVGAEHYLIVDDIALDRDLSLPFFGEKEDISVSYAVIGGIVPLQLIVIADLHPVGELHLFALRDLLISGSDRLHRYLQDFRRRRHRTRNSLRDG